MMMSQMNQAKADFLNKICNFIEGLHINLCGKNLCVCLSGGADSVSLLSALVEIKEKFGYNLFACHFNHMIRGSEADRDELFCKELCKNNNVKLFCGRDDVPAYAITYKLSVEEAARECRYAFFERVADKNNIDYTLTAHNMNDDAETLLYNLIRGSGLNGATAIAPIKGKILRPLLGIKRCEIEAYLNEIGQEFVHDSTNDSFEYTRNYIRNVLMPSIEKINPSVVESLSRYIESARADRDYFEQIVASIDDNDLRKLHKSLRSRVIYKKFTLATGYAPNSSNINCLENAVFNNKRSIISINNDIEAVVGLGKLDFYNKNEIDHLLFDDEKIELGDNLLFGDRVSISISNEINEIVENFNKISTSNILSFDNINGSLYARNRRMGDKICIHGVNKSVKKLLIDKKIPKEYRDIIPVILDEEGIIYIPFVGISDRVFPKDNSNLRKITTILNTVHAERWKNAYEKEEK